MLNSAIWESCREALYEVLKGFCALAPREAA